LEAKWAFLVHLPLSQYQQVDGTALVGLGADGVGLGADSTGFEAKWAFLVHLPLSQYQQVDGTSLIGLGANGVDLGTDSTGLEAKWAFLVHLPLSQYQQFDGLDGIGEAKRTSLGVKGVGEAIEEVVETESSGWFHFLLMADSSWTNLQFSRVQTPRTKKMQMFSGKNSNKPLLVRVWEFVLWQVAPYSHSPSVSHSTHNSADCWDSLQTGWRGVMGCSEIDERMNSLAFKLRPEMGSFGSSRTDFGSFDGSSRTGGGSFDGSSRTGGESFDFSQIDFPWIAFFKKKSTKTTAARTKRTKSDMISKTWKIC
jgi:hypothetical protein